mgnify:CR=1 FL=1
MHHGWLEPDQLIRDAHRLRGIPGTIVHGRYDSTLNRHGIRMGSADIYPAVDPLAIQWGSDGAFVWQPSLSAGQPATLLGYPVIESEDMPDIATNSLSIAFGDFRAGYLIAERTETQILRDPYTNKPFVTFYATKRIGGCVSNSEAIKLMKFAAA